MGVAGVGKTTVGRRLADALGWEFHEADAHHPPANVEKMRRGRPLTDDDREPWLASLEVLLARLTRERRDAVLACSALKQRYRARLRAAAPGLRFVHLRADPAAVRRRLEQRVDHYAGTELLPSQLADLEVPGRSIAIDATAPPPAIVRTVLERLELDEDRS